MMSVMGVPLRRGRPRAGAPDPRRVSIRLILARQELHVLPDRALEVGIPQARRRMVSDDQLGAVIAVGPAAHAPDRALGSHQELGRELAETADQSRLEGRELALEIR